MSKIQKIGLVILILILVSGIGYLASGGYSDLSSLWEPALPSEARGIVTEKDTGVQAKAQYLSQMREEYEETTDNDLKATLRSMILTEAQGVDTSKLPDDLQKFIASLNNE
jgi:hypothetical protein